MTNVLTSDGNAGIVGVTVRRETGIAIVSVNNPSRRNALTPQLASDLVEALTNIDEDMAIGAMVIQGANGTFCSGADLSTLGTAMVDPAGDNAYRDLDQIYRAFTRLGEMTIPTIAAVRGAAVGAGLNLAMAADIRIVSDDARLMSGFLKRGLHPGGGHFQLLARSSSRETAASMAILCQEVSGAQAVRLGLAWEACRDESVESRALDLARNASTDPALTRKAVQSLRLTVSDLVPWPTALQAERAPQLWSMRRSVNSTT